MSKTRNAVRKGRQDEAPDVRQILAHRVSGGKPGPPWGLSPGRATEKPAALCFSSVAPTGAEPIKFLASQDLRPGLESVAPSELKSLCDN